MTYNKENPINKWIVKGNSVHFTNGNMVTFAGKHDNDYYVIMKDESDSFHVNFTINENTYGLHTKDEKTGERKFLLNVYSDVIVDLVRHWQKLKPEWVKDFSANLWKKYEEFVIDVNTNNVPNIRWSDGIYDIEPEDVVHNALPHDEIINLKFSQGLVYNELGICKGMLMPNKKSKKLIRIDRSLTDIVFNTAIGIDALKGQIKKEYTHYTDSKPKPIKGK